jgi:Domain of unknown function (DUF5916)/Carbohydrate family 9 binding domain-like
MIVRLSTTIIVFTLLASNAVAQDLEPVTVRAYRLTQPLVIDGRLDDAVYHTIEPTPAFRQQEPRLGELAIEQTEMWVFFDERNVYVSARMHDSAPDQMIADEMRRDASLYNNEHFAVVFDTFHDRRTGFFFQTNPLGGVRDALIVDENTANYDWNTVWDVKVHRDETGWTSEMVIPFKSLRYPTGTEQMWGINARRWERRVNEHSLLSITPPGTPPNNSVQRLANAATLVGMEAPPPARNVELKPYGVSNLTTNRVSSPAFSNRFDKDIGLDAKYGITSNMTLDMTVNTDFAQVEIDEQQVNLTRFSLFFPEKRDFFLEGQGIFDFANAVGGGFRAPDSPIMFFSRRIGLDAGQPVPIKGGARLTGRVGKTSLGLLEIQTGDGAFDPARGTALTPATNFLVARVKRDILSRSNIGIIATRRSPRTGASGSNALVGVDTSFNLFENVQAGSYYARSDTPGARGNQSSYRGYFRYLHDRYGLETERMKVGDAFNPEVGYVPRPDITRTDVVARFSPRPQSLRHVRRFEWNAELERFVNGRDQLETRVASGTFRTEFHSSDQLTFTYRNDYEFVTAPFRISGGPLVPIGVYEFNEGVVQFNAGAQRAFSGRLTFTAGEFYSGHRQQFEYSGRVKVSSQLAFEPRLLASHISLEEGAFTTKLLGARTTYTVTPRMLVSDLVQYNSSLNTLESNIRWRWEYQPGSDLYVVYTDGRDTFGSRTAALMNRGVAIKATRLLRF